METPEKRKRNARKFDYSIKDEKGEFILLSQKARKYIDRLRQMKIDPEVERLKRELEKKELLIEELLNRLERIKKEGK